MTVVSAPIQRSIFAARGIRNRRNAIHTFATRMSTATNWPNRVESTAKTSFIAAWLAPPPIQLPASVAMPLQVSPATVSGWMMPSARKDTMAPSITPAVPVRNMMIALGPSRSIATRSMAMQNSASELGSM